MHARYGGVIPVTSNPARSHIVIQPSGKPSPQEDTMNYNTDGLKELAMAIMAAIIAFFSITSFFGFVASID
jgi:hypothetical protein